MDKEHIDLLIIVPPAGVKLTSHPPYGAMYIASALRRYGYVPLILNNDVERINNEKVIEKIREINPKYIGISGTVAPSYKYIKDLGLEIKCAFPQKKLILGGGISSAAEVVLKHTAIDIVIIGEGDITIVELIDCLEGKNDLNAVPGIAYKTRVLPIYTGKRELIRTLDNLPYPAFDLIDMDKYLPDGIEMIHSLVTSSYRRKHQYDKKTKRKMITIPTSRGCFAECSFCFRAYKGLRVHSMKYVFDFIEYCIEKFDVGFFTFGDECFAPNKKRNWDFIEEYKKRNLNIIFRIFGMRVDTVDKEILQAYKEIGCWMIEYGFESGSNKILNIINKKVTVEKNRQVALWTSESGVYTSPALVLGMPGENNDTIRESINFLKSLNLDFKQYQLTYALPIPGSHLYDFSIITGIIKDEDEYLSSLDGRNRGLLGKFQVNLTDEPDNVVVQWATTIMKEVDKHYLFKKYKSKVIVEFMLLLGKVYINYQKKQLWVVFQNKIKKVFCFKMIKVGKNNGEKVSTRFKKPPNINIEELVKGLDYSKINREMALKKINQKLIESHTLEKQAQLKS